MDVIMGFFLFLLLRKRKPKQKAPPKTEPAVQVHSNLNPERAIKFMPGAYTVAEAKNHVRIVQDCLNIFEKTKNLETFFSRYEYGMQIALTVDQAAKAGIIPYTSDLPASFFKAADSQKERVLLDSYSDQKAKIDELKTAKAKATHWNRYLNTLKEYEDQYSMNPDSEYPEVLEQVKGELAKLDLSTSVPPSNPWKHRKIKALEQMVQIKRRFPIYSFLLYFFSILWSNIASVPSVPFLKTSTVQGFLMEQIRNRYKKMTAPGLAHRKRSGETNPFEVNVSNAFEHYITWGLALPYPILKVQVI